MAVLCNISKPGQCCIVVKEEIPDLDDHLRMESRIELEEHRMLLKNVPVNREKQDLLDQLPTDICVNSEQLDSYKDTKPNTVSSDELTKSLEGNNNFEVEREMSSLQKKCNLEKVNDDIHFKDKVEGKGHICESSNNYWNSKIDDSTSNCKDTVDLTVEKITTNMLRSSTQQTLSKTGPKQATLNYKFKTKDINTNLDGELTCQLVKIEDIGIKLKEVEHSDSLFQGNINHSQYENKDTPLQPYCKNTVKTGFLEVDVKPQKFMASFCQENNTLYHEKSMVLEKSFTYKESVSSKKHKSIHTGDKLFTTNIDNESFSQPLHLLDHTRMNSKEKPFACAVFNKSLTHSSLTVPKKTHTKQKLFTCDICNKSFSKLCNLKSHKKTHTKEKPFICDICNNCFSRSYNLLCHKKTHTKERPFTCDVCNISFTRSTNLVYHKRIHTMEKPFTCGICNMTFSVSSNLISHKRTHTKEKPYSCNVCNKSFSRSSHLGRHKRVHTKEKPFICNYCTKSFSHSTGLVCHKRIHTKEKPFTCNICYKTFSLSSNLISHKKTHVKEKPFTCNFCKKSFSSKRYLQVHVDVHFQS